MNEEYNNFNNLDENDDDLHSTFLMFVSFPVCISHCELIVICE